MSITDELREYAHGWDERNRVRRDLRAIADRIDAEYDKALNSVDDAYDSGYNVGYDEGFASADDWLAQHEDAMAEHGWIRLTKDADDVPWRIGDRDEDGNVVTQLRLSSDGWYAVTDGPSAFHPDQRRHYHAPTVEDVLTEFGIDWEHESDCEDRAALLKEYAAKLRLAEGVD